MTIKQILQRGIVAHNEGNLKEAERLYRAILQSQPKHPHANHNLGLLATSFNKTVAALVLFKTALEANPKIKQFWLSYINALIKEHLFEIARQVFNQAKNQGIAGEKLNVLGVKLSLKAQMQNVAILSPSQKQLISLLEHYQNERFADAERLAISITKEFPQHQFAWKVLSIILKKNGRVTDSLTAMQTSMKLVPQDAEAHYNLGLKLQEQGRLDEAEASHNQAIALKPDYAEAYCDLGVTLHKLKRFGEAEANYTKAIAFNPNYARAHMNLGIAFQELGRLEESENSLIKAKEFKPDFAQTYFNLGVTLHKLKRLGEAIDSYNQAIALKPKYAQAYSNLGILLHELGRYDKAEYNYNQAIALKPDYAEAHFNMGVTLQELGRLDEAGTSYKQAITLKPDYINAARNLVQLPVGHLDSETLNLCERVFDIQDKSLEFQIKYFFFHGNLLKRRGYIEQSFNAFCKANKLKAEVSKDEIIVEAKKNIDSLIRIDKWVPCLPELDEKRITKLFIMGPSRSGKSTVELILNKSSRVKALFETIIHNRLKKNNDYGRGSSELLFKNIFSCNEGKLLNQGYKVITSTNPSNIFYSDYLMNMLPNAYLIIVKRDHRDVSPEIFTSEYNSENLYSYDTKEILKYLDVYNRICDTLAVKIPDRCLTVSFEDIIQAPKDVVERN